MANTRDRAYIAALWEHPDLCIAFFGVQFLTDEGRQLYEESGINDQIGPSLDEAEGLLLHRGMMTEEGPVSMQYWRTYADLDRYARRTPHSRWWKWLVQHTGQGVAFYHEIYQARTAEAIYEPGTHPVGPAIFCTTIEVEKGEGRSTERQRLFAEAVHTDTTAAAE